MNETDYERPPQAALVMISCQSCGAERYVPDAWLVRDLYCNQCSCRFPMLTDDEWWVLHGPDRAKTLDQYTCWECWHETRDSAAPRCPFCPGHPLMLSNKQMDSRCTSWLDGLEDRWEREEARAFAHGPLIMLAEIPTTAEEAHNMTTNTIEKPKEATTDDQGVVGTLMRYFGKGKGQTILHFRDELKQLSRDEKKALADGINNGSFTY